MIDFLTLSLILGDQQINYKSLEFISSGPYGDRFKLKTSSNAKYTGNTPIVSITHGNKLTFKGSLPYLLNDNNLVPFSLLEVQEAFNDLSNRLGIDLSEAIVNNFEFGVAVMIPFPFKEFIHHHLSLSKMDSSLFPTKGKYFQDKMRQIKLYDAGRNAKYKLSLSIRQSLSNRKQYDKNSRYAKFEIRYMNPRKYFKQVIKVRDLMDIDFLGMCTEDLLETYKSINKTGFSIPTTVRELTTAKILAIVLKEIEQLTKIDVESMVENTIKTLGLLNHGQKHARRITIKKAFKAVHSSLLNPYDISNLLKEATEKFLQSVA